MGSLGSETITAENVHQLFPDVDTHLAKSHKVPTSDEDLKGYDEEQVRLMEEVCIVLDENDAPIGSASKKTCHLMTNIDRGVPGETGDNLEAAVLGVKRAAQRKLEQELGIKAHQVPIDQFRFLTRIHYKAPSDGKWGEHEIDYILFIKADVDHTDNPNEVRDSRYVTAEELKVMFEDTSLKFTPWFKLICNTMLFQWWEHLDNGLEKFMNEQEIRRM